MQTINVGQGQTLADIALVYGGQLESVWEIVIALGIGLTDEIVVEKSTIPIFSNDKKAFFSNRQPATNLVAVSEGVDFWETELEFTIT
jgi:hypothetical protein